MFIVVASLLLSILVSAFLIYKALRKNVTPLTRNIEFVFLLSFTISFILFVFGLMNCDADYYVAIDNIDRGYTPFATKHILTLSLFSLFSLLAIFLLWLKGRLLPPLTLVITLVFVVIGIIISAATLLQTSPANTNNVFHENWLFQLLPKWYILSALILFIKISREEAVLSQNRTYKNKLLNSLNNMMSRAAQQPLWVLLLIVPVSVLIVGILVLFGQAPDALIKVFTETATWNFSKQTHPPFLDYRGHYLCTVAVCGNPELVKPLRFGKRHGQEIIVNRQLLIANAFEQLVEENLPAFHKIIRHLYDKYGYPLSKDITTPEASDLVYRLMKPLEYFFLIVLYLCCTQPETKIDKQYRL